MPKIPGYRADLQREIRAPYETGDSTPAKIRNQGLQSFANGLQDFGQGAMRQEALDEVKRKEAENIAIANFTTSAKGVSDALSYAAFEKANPDGSDLIKNYSDEFDKQMQGELKKITDPLAQQKAYGKLLEIKNDRLERLRSDSDKMFKENANLTYENQMKVGVSRVTANPTLIDKELNDYTATLSKSGYSQTNKLKAFELGKKEMVTGALNGYINSGDYGAAKAKLATKFAGVFDANEIDKWVTKIEAEEIKSISLSIESVRNEEKNFELAQKQIQDKNFTKMYKDIVKMNEVDPYAPGNGTKVIEVSEQLDSMVESGEMRAVEASHLKRFINKEESDESSEVTLSLYNKLSSGDNVERVKQEVLSASASKQISPETAQTLLGRIDFESQRQSARARVGRSKRMDPLIKVGSDLIAAHFKPEYVGDTNTANLKESQTDAMAVYLKLLETPKYKNKPVDAARVALGKTKTGYAPPSKYKSVDEIKKAAASDKALFKKGKISLKEYDKRSIELDKFLVDFQAGGI